MTIVLDVTKKSQEEQVERESGRVVPTCDKDKQNKSAVLNPMVTFESRLVRMKLTMTDHHDR